MKERERRENAMESIREQKERLQEEKEDLLVRL